MRIRLIIAPTSQKLRYDILTEIQIGTVTKKRIIFNELPLIHVIQYLENMPKQYGDMGFIQNRREDYPLGGKMVEFSKSHKAAPENFIAH